MSVVVSYQFHYFIRFCDFFFKKKTEVFWICMYVCVSGSKFLPSAVIFYIQDQEGHMNLVSCYHLLYTSSYLLDPGF